MDPQNSDPNTPTPSPVQPDLNSSFPDPLANPNPPPAPPEPMPEPTPPIPPPIPDPPIQPPAPPTPSGFNWSNPTIPTADPASPAPIPSFQAAPSTPEFASPTPTDSGPTDLSQLTNQAEQPVFSPPLSQLETLVVPPSSPEPTTLQTDGGGHGVPKWIWFVGSGLVLAVAGASAYFILGFGQSQDTTSLPATEQTLIAPPTPSPITQAPSPSTSSSATFGGISGSGAPQATSAADLLRQRQQQGQ